MLRVENCLLSLTSEQCHVVVNCKAIHTGGVSLFSSPCSSIWVCLFLPLAIGLLPEDGDPLVVVVDDSLLVLVEVVDERELEAGRSVLQPLQLHVPSVKIGFVSNSHRSVFYSTGGLQKDETRVARNLPARPGRNGTQSSITVS